MTIEQLLQTLARCPLIASVQASDGSALGDPTTLLKLARASADQGVRVLRLQGVEAIRLIRAELGLPVIGLIKRDYPGSNVYITPTVVEVDALIAEGCEVIALDGTARPRPEGADLADLIASIHAAGRLAMADCDSLESLAHAEQCGADILSTTLAGYTGGTASVGPDLELLRKGVRSVGKPLLAEGRFNEPWQVAAALRIGAVAVVIGGSLNDPVKQTRTFLGSVPSVHEPVGAVDIGGTWMRFGLFSPDWKLQELVRAPLPSDRAERLSWIRAQVSGHGVKHLGVSTGGTVDPRTGLVWEAKPIVPDHVGTGFAELAEHVVALNDGLATAWGHACLPLFAGLRIATLALGTGVGCGFVSNGRMWMGPHGEYTRLNDLPAAEGCSFEDLLGGAALSAEPSDEAKGKAQVAFDTALKAIEAFYMPDAVVVCGGVGLAGWLHTGGAVRSPFGADAGLYGAAALVLFGAGPQA